MTTLTCLPPKPGCKIEVIGAGLGRTGTTSFCAALSILLNGPAYHSGVQYATGTTDESHIETWISAIKLRPYAHHPEKKSYAYNLISKRLDGYVATADPPLTQLMPELMELYPEAKVICTVRERESWAKSQVEIARLATPTFMKYLFYLVPTIRHLYRLYPQLTNIFMERYGATVFDMAGARQVWDRHHAWLEEIVPKGKLFYVDVKEGWEPLCKALDLPVPEGVEFPQLNDGKDFEKVFKGLARRGVERWCVLIGVVVVIVAVAVYFWIALGVTERIIIASDGSLWNLLEKI